MSVGHVSRILEEAGIPTVIVASRVFQKPLEAMAVPRLLSTPHVMGRPVGPPGNRPRQREVLLAAFDLLENAQENGTVFEMPGAYAPALRE